MPFAEQPIGKEKRLNHPANPSLNHGDRNPNPHTTRHPM